MHGDRLRSRPCYFSPFFPGRGSGTPPPTTESDHSAPICPDKNKPTATKGVRDHSTHWSSQVLKLTDYHISQHVASTFKSLKKYTTYRDLNIFSLRRKGITNTTTPLVIPILLQNLKSIKSYNLASGRKPLVFYRS